MSTPADAESRAVVVAAAIVRQDRGTARVLACRRVAPPEAAGRWELPGGKVEPGEGPEAALVREVGEELGCLVEVVEWLPPEAPIGERHLLRAALVRQTAGEIRPREHDAVRWLAADELDEIDWLEPDRPFLPHVRRALDPEAPDPDARVRAVFFEEEDAEAVVAQLVGEGWQAEVGRERYQGEDDDEGHPWAVLTDAPLFLVEVLVDEHEGWLDLPDDEEAALGVAPEPVDLPPAPKRVKRPGTGDLGSSA